MKTHELTQSDGLDEAVHSFDRDGYLVIEDALPPERVRLLISVINRIKEELSTSSHRKEVYGLDIRPILSYDDAFLDLMEWPATFPVAVRLLRHYNIQLMTSHLIMVPPKPNARNIEWHRDGGTPDLLVNGIPPLFSLKIGYFLTDLLESNMGALMVVPGSHRLRWDQVQTQAGQDPLGAVEVKVPAGAAVIFQQGLMHAGAPNTSTQTRIVLYYGYGYRFIRPLDYDQMPESLLQKCSPVGRQLLGAKATHLGYAIPTDADCPLKQWSIDRFGKDWLVR